MGKVDGRGASQSQVVLECKFVTQKGFMDYDAYHDQVLEHSLMPAAVAVIGGGIAGVQSALDVGLDAEFFKYKKEVAVPGCYAVIAGNAVSAAEGIKDVLGPEYKAIAVNPNCAEIYAIADYNEQLRKVCNVG